jgi:hypothetical protein
VHLYQHLDLYVDGRQVSVPAGIGIDPAVGFAPLHTHDASRVIHLESPTVRTYTLGQFLREVRHELAGVGSELDVILGDLDTGPSPDAS